MIVSQCKRSLVTEVKVAVLATHSLLWCDSLGGRAHGCMPQFTWVISACSEHPNLLICIHQPVPSHCMSVFTTLNQADHWAGILVILYLIMDLGQINQQAPKDKVVDCYKPKGSISQYKSLEGWSGLGFYLQIKNPSLLRGKRNIVRLLQSAKIGSRKYKAGVKPRKTTKGL